MYIFQKILLNVSMHNNKINNNNNKHQTKIIVSNIAAGMEVDGSGSQIFVFIKIHLILGEYFMCFGNFK